MLKNIFSRAHPFVLQLIGVCVLAAGLVSAVLIYRSADDADSEGQVYEFVGGEAYATSVRDTKAYRHDLERFGGKASLFADDLKHWLASLWGAKGLAGFVAAVAILLTRVFFYAASSRSRAQRAGRGMP